MKKLEWPSLPAWAGLFVLITLSASAGRTQEIRRLTEPNQPVRMPHGGYVCEGRLNISPIDDTYDMVTCSGPIYAAADYAAVYTKLEHDELANLNAVITGRLANDLKANIDKRFRQLPHNLQQAPAVVNLEKSLLEYVDERLPENLPESGLRPRADSPVGAATAPPAPADQ